MMLKHLDIDAYYIENVAGLVLGEMRRLYFMVKKILNEMPGWNHVDGILNSVHYGVGQIRRRWICIGLKNEYGVATLPPPDIAGADSLRIKYIDPSIQCLTTGYHDGYGRHVRSIRTKHNWCYTITATPNVWDQDEKLLTIPQVMKFFGYPEDWIYDTEHFMLAWRRFGNSVPPKLSEAIMRHIKMMLTRKPGDSSSAK